MERKSFHLCIAAVLLHIIASAVAVPTQETDLEKKLEGPSSSETTAECEDESAVSVCDEAVRANCDPQNPLTRKCHRSCHLCVVAKNQREWTSEEERASKCKDMIPECNVYANPAVCCAVKPLANATCQRSCRFCYDMNSIPVVSGLVPLPSGGSNSVTGDGPVIYQDPCNPTAPPSASSGGGSGPNIPGAGNMGSSIPGAPGGLPGGGSSGSNNNNNNALPGGGQGSPIPSNPIG